MRTQSVTNNEPDTMTLSEIVVPLASALQQFTQNPWDEIRVVEHTFEGQEARDFEAFIDLDVGETPDQLLQALWTIIQKSDSCVCWLNFAVADQDNPCGGPIIFALVQQRYGPGEFECHSYLWCYCQEEEFDPEAAKRQIASLVDLIGDSNNLRELTSQHRVQL